jgi:hypothetical protein
MSEQVEHVARAERPPTLGRPRTVAAMQRLVEEPLTAVVIVGHRGYFWRILGSFAVASFASDTVLWWRDWTGMLPRVSLMLALFLVLAIGLEAVVDTLSPLHLRGWNGVIAVSESTVYVARGSFLTGQPTAITTTFPRDSVAIVPGRLGWGRRGLTLTAPRIGTVRLAAPAPVTSGENQDALSSMGRPPQAEWRPDPDNPGQLRWWDGGELTRITTPER